MASIKEGLMIEKLNDKNYATWKFKVEMLLIKEELLEIVTDEIPEQITNDWNKKDRRARALINLSIEDSQIINVKNETTAKATWDTLKRIHERSNLSSKLFLLRKLYGTKLNEGGDLNVHITKLLELIDKLKSIGENIDDSHVSALLLCSLPKSYDGLITALEARPENELNSEFIRNKLIDEYNRRQDSSEAGRNNQTKVYKTQTKNHSYKRDNKYCSNCRLKNHNTHECWHLRGKGPNNKRYNDNNRVANNSAKYKQHSSVCFEIDENNESENRSRREKRNSNSEKDKDRDIVYKIKNLTFLTGKIDKNSWVIDSGSSSHICNNRQLFTELDDTKRSTVMVANGNTLKSLGSGTVKIKTEFNGSERNITLKNVLFVPDIETNLMSVRKATENGCEVIFQDNNCKLMYNGITYLNGIVNNDLYEVKQIDKHSDDKANLVHECKNKNCIDLWHKRLGHRNYNSLKELKQLVSGIEIDMCRHKNVCEECIK